MIGYLFESKGFSRIDIDTNESDPSYSLAGQLMGPPLKSLQGFGASLRTTHLRDPVVSQIQFASESFM